MPAIMPWRVSPGDAQGGRAARSLPRLAVRGDAAANHRRRGARLFPPVHRALADGRRSGGGRGCRCDGRMGGAWLLRPRPQPAEMRPRRCGRSWRASSRATRDGLLELPGIGPYTAAAIAAIAFDEPATVVDGNVERVMARLFDIETPLPAAKPELTALAAGLTPRTRPGDYAQAVMDLGATICTPTSPACGICPWTDRVRGARAGTAGRPAPQTAEKAQADPPWHRLSCAARRWRVAAGTPPRQGAAGRHAGLARVRLGRRADRTPPPIDADWRDPGAEVRHTFTHFHLRLSLRVADVTRDTQPKSGAVRPAHPVPPLRPADRDAQGL